MNPRATSVLLTALAAGALSLTGCAQPAAPQATRPVDRVTVVTSTDVYASVATAVAGDRATVTPLITSPDADPHEYESTAKDAATVGGAKVLVANGGGYDDFAAKLVESAPVKPAVIDVSELSGLKPAEGPAEAGGEAHGTEETARAPGAEPGGGEEHAHGGFNEHVWYHPPTMAKLADRLAADLGTADPAGVATYTANAGVFKARLDELNAKLAAVKATHSGQRVALTEPVAGYLVEAAGLVNATPEEFTEAAEEGNDPPAAVLNQTLELFRADPVRALLLNPQAQNAATKQVEEAARAAGVPVVTMTETLPAGVTDYVAWMGGQVDQLTAAMDRR